MVNDSMDLWRIAVGESKNPFDDEDSVTEVAESSSPLEESGLVRGNGRLPRHERYRLRKALAISTPVVWIWIGCALLMAVAEAYGVSSEVTNNLERRLYFVVAAFMTFLLAKSEKDSS